MRFVKILAGLLVIVLILPVAALAVLAFIDLNNFKPQIEAQIERATGRKLEIAGNIDLAIGLQPTFQIETVTMANAAWGNAANFAEIGRLDVKADLVPLLSGEMVIDHIELVEPKVWLETDADGRGNWQFGAAELPRQTDDLDQDPDSDDPFIPLIQRFLIERGAFHYRDEQTGQSNELLVERAELLIDKFSDPVTLMVKGTLDDSPIDAQGQTGSIENMVAGGAAFPINFNASALGVTASIDGIIQDPKAVSGINLALTAQAESFAGLGSLVEGQSLPVAPGRIGPFAFSAKITGDASDIKVEDLDLSLSALGIKAKATGGLNLVDGKPDAQIDLSIDADDLNGLAELLDANIPDHPLSLRAQIDGDPNKTVKIGNFDFSFGPNRLGGNAAIRLDGVRPEISAELAGDELDLAILMSPAAGQQAVAGTQEPQQASDRLFSDDALPLEVLEAIDATIGLTLAKLITPQLSLDNVDVQLALKDGKLELSPLTFVLDEAQPSISLALAKAGGELDVNLKLDADSFDYGSLLSQLGVTDLLEGAGNIALDLRANGDSIAALAASLDGSVTSLAGKGRVKSELLDQWLPGLTNIVDTVFQNTDGEWIVLECVALDLFAESGIVTPRAMLINADSVLVSGQGSVDLATEKLDLKVVPQAKAVGSITLPIGIQGSIKAPGIGLDRSDAADQLTSLLGVQEQGGAGEPSPALASLKALGATDDHPCINPPTVEPAGVTQQLDEILSDPKAALETIVPDQDEALESLGEDPEKKLEETGKNLLRGVLGGN